MMNTTRNRANIAIRHGIRRGLSAAAIVLICGLAPAVSHAVDLTLPSNAEETARKQSPISSFAIATGPATNGALPSQSIEGQINQAAWRIRAQGITTLQLLQPLRDQLADAGFETLFECEARACGGFDFRYQIDVFAEPDMHVDLFDYRYLSARRSGTDGASEHVALLVSRSSAAGYIQIVQIQPQGTQAPKTTSSGKPATTSQPVTQPGADLPFDQQLLASGHAVLSDLTFETGSSTLGAGPFSSLDALSAFLLADPSRRVALVGHTDAVGALDNNIALSRRRATSVLERLVKDFNIPRAQLEAGGMGYLSPITSNLTPEGRDANRRVEAVLLNTE